MNTVGGFFFVSVGEGYGCAASTTDLPMLYTSIGFTYSLRLPLGFRIGEIVG